MLIHFDSASNSCQVLAFSPLKGRVGSFPNVCDYDSRNYPHDRMKYSEHSKCHRFSALSYHDWDDLQKADFGESLVVELRVWIDGNFYFLSWNVGDANFYKLSEISDSIRVRRCKFYATSSGCSAFDFGSRRFRLLIMLRSINWVMKVDWESVNGWNLSILRKPQFFLDSIWLRCKTEADCGSACGKSHSLHIQHKKNRQTVVFENIFWKLMKSWKTTENIKQLWVHFGSGSQTSFWMLLARRWKRKQIMSKPVNIFYASPSRFQQRSFLLLTNRFGKIR